MCAQYTMDFAEYVGSALTFFLRFLCTAEGAWGVTVGIVVYAVIKHYWLQPKPASVIHQQSAQERPPNQNRNDKPEKREAIRESEKPTGRDNNELTQSRNKFARDRTLFRAPYKCKSGSSVCSNTSDSSPERSSSEESEPPRGRLRYIKGFGSWKTTDEEEAERQFNIHESWKKFIVEATTKDEQDRKTEAVDFVRARFSKSGSNLRTSSWAKEDR